MIFGEFRHHAGRISEANRRHSPLTSSTRLSLTRGARTSTAQAEVSTYPRLGLAVTYLQPPAVLVELVGVRGDVRGDQHAPCALAHDLVDQRPPIVPGSAAAAVHGVASVRCR